MTRERRRGGNDFCSKVLEEVGENDFWEARLRIGFGEYFCYPGDVKKVLVSRKFEG